jgi:thiol-disulfide isomerase/thioredoxin
MKFFSLDVAIKFLLLVGVLAIVFVSVKSCQKPATGVEAYAVGSLQRLTALDDPPVQPGLVFTSADGEEMRLEDYRGETVLLNVWASWCAPCIAELPTLEALAVSRDDIEVVTISLDRTPEEAAAFLEREGIELPRWWDGSFSLSGKLLAPGLPITVIYNEGGREMARLAGEAEWDSAEANALLDALVE